MRRERQETLDREGKGERNGGKKGDECLLIQGTLILQFLLLLFQMYRISVRISNEAVSER